MHIQVIVPCYNPPADWETALVGRFTTLHGVLADLGLSAGLVVVNDGSPRGVTTAHLERLSALLPAAKIVSYVENRGKGYALRQGVAAIESDLYLVTDFDFPYTLESMARVAETLLQKGGVAAGNRDTTYYAHVPLFRRLLSKFLRWMLRNLLRQPISDSQCGLKGFDAAGKAIFLQTTIDRFLFDLEFLMLANGKVPVTPVPVELRPGVVFSKVGWKILTTEIRNFLRLLFSTH